MKKRLTHSLIALPMVLLMASSCLAAKSQGTLDPKSGKPCIHCHPSRKSLANVHPALAEDDCIPCHKVTPGDHQKNHALFAVKDTSANLCWECHESVDKQKSVHPIITAEGCLGCHAPHSSSNAKLLKEKAPGLCFQCHEHAAFKEEKTRKATAFRDGEQNLHYLHAIKNSIRCLACHEVHASPQGHLIRPKGTNGKDQVTITYSATDQGGSCTASCHDTLAYQRK